MPPEKEKQLYEALESLGLEPIELKAKDDCHVDVLISPSDAEKAKQNASKIQEGLRSIGWRVVFWKDRNYDALITLHTIEPMRERSPVYYHITNLSNLLSISRRGLIPLPNYEYINNPVPAVYLSSDLDFIYDQSRFLRGLRNTVILAVTVPPTHEIYKDCEYDITIQEAVYVTERIPPENIKVVKPAGKRAPGGRRRVKLISLEEAVTEYMGDMIHKESWYREASADERLEVLRRSDPEAYWRELIRSQKPLKDVFTKDEIIQFAREGKLQGANLSGAVLSGADLTAANLTGANLWEANLRGAYLTGAKLTRADLREATFWGAYLEGANLAWANLEGAYLEGADLRGANLGGAILREAILREATFWEADLSGADLQRANLQDSDLREANLRYADLRDADLRRANLEGADNLGADLEGADLTGATYGPALTRRP